MVIGKYMAENGNVAVRRYFMASAFIQCMNGEFPDLSISYCSGGLGSPVGPFTWQPHYFLTFVKPTSGSGTMTEVSNQFPCSSGLAQWCCTGVLSISSCSENKLYVMDRDCWTSSACVLTSLLTLVLVVELLGYVTSTNSKKHSPNSNFQHLNEYFNCRIFIQALHQDQVSKQ